MHDGKRLANVEAERGVKGKRAIVECGLHEANSGSAEMWAHGLVGMVHSTAEWWLDHRTVSRAALADELAALAWTGVACMFPPTAGTMGS